MLVHPVFAYGGPIGHYASLVPLVACLIQSARRREPPNAAWLLSAAFTVSYVADSLGESLAARGFNNHWISYAYAPVQLAILLLVVAEAPRVRWAFTAGFGLLAAVSALRGPLQSPEGIVQILGGLVVSWLAWRAPNVGLYRRAIWLYCLGTLPGLVLMLAVPLTSEAWIWGWGGYQVARVVGVGFMAWAILVPAPTLEVVRGGRLAQNRDRNRRVGGRALAYRPDETSPLQRHG